MTIDRPDRGTPPAVVRLNLAGRPARLHFGDARIEARLHDWIAGFAGAEPNPGTCAGRDVPPAGDFDADPSHPGRGILEFHWSVGTPPPPPRVAPRAVVDYYHVTGSIEDGRVVFRTTDGGWMTMDPARDRIDFRIPPAMLDGPAWSLRDLFGAAFTAVLRRQGRYPIHAAGLAAPPGTATPPHTAAAGLLVVGAPMSGKTTLALNFVRRGWGWLSDDKILLEPVAAGIGMRGLFRPANVDPALGRYFPEMQGLTARAAAFPNSDKRTVSIDAVYGLTHPGVVPVTHLVFPRVVDTGPTEVAPLSHREALLRMLEHSPIQNEAVDAGRQVALLGRLASDTRAFQLRLGRDLLETPDRLSDIGRTIGLSIGAPLDRGAA